MSAIHEEVLGRLEWDDRTGDWRGGLDLFPNFHVGISVEPQEDLARTLIQARESLSWLRENEDYARRCIADELLETYNGSWSEEERPISLEEFIDRIELLDVDFAGDGSVGLWYDAGEMFGGHAIVAEFDRDRRIREAHLVG
jgi:hypothetical protein